jgi:uncharacterized C2H2 Zn-finger protein
MLGPLLCHAEQYELTEKHGWLIYRERKILFRLKKQAEKDGL